MSKEKLKIYISKEIENDFKSLSTKFGISSSTNVQWKNETFKKLILGK